MDCARSLEDFHRDITTLDIASAADRQKFRAYVDVALGDLPPAIRSGALDIALEQLYQLDQANLTDSARAAIGELIELCISHSPAAVPLHRALMWTGGSSPNMSTPSA